MTAAALRGHRPDEVHERALGAYLGFAVGDALGAPVAFMTPAEIQHAYGMHRDMVRVAALLAMTAWVTLSCVGWAE